MGRALTVTCECDGTGFVQKRVIRKGTPAVVMARCPGFVAYFEEIKALKEDPKDYPVAYADGTCKAALKFHEEMRGNRAARTTARTRAEVKSEVKDKLRKVIEQDDIPF